MEKIMGLLFVLLMSNSFGQLTCADLMQVGHTYTLTSSKNGKGKLFITEPKITKNFKYADFNLTLVSNLPAEIQAEMKAYKINLASTDTVILYDWDIMHQAKMGYFGPAVGRVKFDCKDSVLHIYKYLLNKDTHNYVPTRFKIFKLGPNNFILNDMDHPYLNINFYFRKNKD